MEIFGITFAKQIILAKAVDIIIAILVLIIGFKVANYLTKLMDKSFKRHKLDPLLSKFLISITKAVLKVFVILTALKMVGIEITIFVAAIGGIGLALGLGFQGALSNFAGGILLLVVKPFKVGDYIKAGGEEGVVDEIGIIYTKLHTLDNKLIMLPNGSLANANIINYTDENIRRVDLVFGASYDAPVEKVKKAIENVIEQHNLILKKPEYFVRLSAHNSSSLDYTVRVWTKTEDYWTVYFDLLEQVKEKFDQENISIPYNILDVNLKK